MQVPVLGELFGPIALVADPVVRRIPFVNPMLVVFPLEKVPYAFPGQFNVILETVIPCPIRLLRRAAVPQLGLTTNCAEVVVGNNKQQTIATARERVAFLIMGN